MVAKALSSLRWRCAGLAPHGKIDVKSSGLLVDLAERTRRRVPVEIGAIASMTGAGAKTMLAQVVFGNIPKFSARVAIFRAA